MRSLKTLSVFPILSILGCGSTPTKPSERSPAGTASSPPAPSVVGPFVSDMRQITFAGRRAGEGYFSHDGRYMTFQSERQSDNPFYQIYLMDLKDGATRRISTGQGKTTCSWIHPDNKHILFSSTHADPKLKQKVQEEWEARKNPKGKYSWSFDDTYDLYQSDFKGKNLKNLTHSPGYDAEGSYSPDGKWIAFASNRLAYTEPMTEEQRKLFERDPSYMMDIYIMRADGSDVKRLTSAPGYDGGPFFSPDGKRITFRRFSVEGGTAEVFTINTDGTDEKQITHMKAMSWAPFYHPSGDYLIFASNKMGYANFELYIVDAQGKQEPVRVTDIEGFDGLPVFTPGGNNLVWTHGDDRGEAQLYRAKWNDALARRALKLDPVVPQIKLMTSAIDAQDARTWVEYLASEHLQGRPTGSTQEKEYLKTVSTAFQDLGIKPAGKEYLQKYEFTSGVELEGKNGLELQLGAVTDHPAIAGDWIPLSFSKTGHFATAPLVFAGYGIVSPAMTGQPAYDSYADLDVKDKWVVAFADLPEDVSNDRRFYLHQYSRMQFKATTARNRGAVGLILIEDSATPTPNLHLAYDGRSEDAGIPVIRLSSQLADKLFSSSKTSRAEWTKKLGKGEVATFTFSKVTAQADVNMHLKKSTAYNVLGLLTIPGATSTVVIGAHGDHLGHGEMGNSLYRDPKPAIHYGADDNASGVAGVMEIAQDLSAKVKSKAVRLKQNVLFAVWTGEEIGVLGSTYFVNNLGKLKVSAYLNMDMIGRYRDQLLVQGTGSAPQWPALIENTNAKDPLAIRTQQDPYLPTDSLAFYMKQIPTLGFFTGSHPEYHTPSDKPDLINYSGLQKTVDWVERMAVTLASSAQPLVSYSKVEDTKKPGEGRGFRLYLGTVPDYTQEGKNGVVISGTSKDSPAEKAGLKAGDTIVELGGMKIQNLYDYVYCLQSLKANASTPVRVLRKGEEKKLEITPVIRVQ